MIKGCTSSFSLLTSQFSLSLHTVREQSEGRGGRQRDGRVIFPLMLCSFEPWRKKRKREKGRAGESCNRLLFISGQMRGVWLLLVWVCPEQRNISKQEERYNSPTVHVFKHSFYFMNLLALVRAESPAGEKLIAFFFPLTSLILHSETRRDCRTDERLLERGRFMRYCQTLWLLVHVALQGPCTYTWESAECGSRSMQKNREGISCQSVSRGDRALKERSLWSKSFKRLIIFRSNYTVVFISIYSKWCCWFVDCCGLVKAQMKKTLRLERNLRVISSSSKCVIYLSINKVTEDAMYNVKTLGWSGYPTVDLPTAPRLKPRSVVRIGMQAYRHVLCIKPYLIFLHLKPCTSSPED